MRQGVCKGRSYKVFSVPALRVFCGQIGISAENPRQNAAAELAADAHSRRLGANTGDGVLECGDGNRFREMSEEADFVATTNVLRAAIARHSDARKLITVMEFLHELIAVAVRQTDIRNHEVEWLLLGGGKAGLNSSGSRYSETAVLQEAGNDLQRVFVIINEQHAKTRGGIERWGRGQRTVCFCFVIEDQIQTSPTIRIMTFQKPAAMELHELQLDGGCARVPR